MDRERALRLRTIQSRYLNRRTIPFYVIYIASWVLEERLDAGVRYLAKHKWHMSGLAASLIVFIVGGILLAILFSWLTKVGEELKDPVM